MNPAALTIKLPYPISANRYWGSRVIESKGRKMSIIYVTHEARAYREEVGWMVKAAGLHKPFEGRVHIHFDLHPHRPLDADKRMRRDPMGWEETVQCIDLDNARKVLYDALKGVAIVDDKWVWGESATRCEPDGEARVIVTIKPIVRTSPQRLLLEAA